LRGLFRALSPKKVGLKARLASFPTSDLPIERRVYIRWNNYQVPHIEAETDHDLFATLGMVHAHLRGGQIGLFRMFYNGRLSEMFGPFTKNLDHALRVIDYAQAAEEIEQDMPDETRAWNEAFLKGMNVYQERQKDLPPEYGLLGITHQPCTMRELIVGARFAGTDFTWLTLMSLLPRRGQPGFAKLWNRTLEAGENPTPGSHAEGTPGTLEDLLVGAGRGGSNAFAVAPHRSVSGGALLANDPHLGLSLPNLWILVGLRSPSFNLVGFMIPGLPIIALGRNLELAWGGTNMRAASSDLFDVTNLDSKLVETEETTISARFWSASKHQIRRTPFGPIITDAKVLKAPKDRSIALKWIGHNPTEEFTCFFNAARAKTPEEFRGAFKGYGISGQNMLFADKAGNIGRIMAVTLPRRNGFPKDDPVLDPADPNTHWREYADALDLPWMLNPASGVLASANERPTDTDVPVGFTFGSDDRIRRLYERLNAREQLTLDDIQVLQRDTTALDAATLATRLAREIEAIPDFVPPPKFLRRLSRWSGDYSADSSGAVAFEALLCYLVTVLYEGKRTSDLPDLLGQWSFLTTFLIPDLMALEPAKRHEILRAAVKKAAPAAKRYKRWGNMHRLTIGHSLSKLPVIGRAFIVKEIAVGGSRQTPMKMAHGLVDKRHNASFGQMARHVSDLSDEDANWFVLLGGNDGWLGSANYADQVELWRDGRYVRMPLKPETIATEFPHLMQLEPVKD